MSFKRYMESIIEEFNEDCLSCGLITTALTDEQKEEIRESFKQHEHCYENKTDFDKEALDIMGVVIYGDNSNVAIECNQCDSIIIDNEILGAML